MIYCDLNKVFESQSIFPGSQGGQGCYLIRIVHGAVLYQLPSSQHDSNQLYLYFLLEENYV